jgi:hypothetical protein
VLAKAKTRLNANRSDYLGFYSTQESVKKRRKTEELRGLSEPLKVGNAKADPTVIFAIKRNQMILNK